MMVTVAVVAFLIWGATMGARSYNYYRLARTYSAHERGWRDIANRNPSMAVFGLEGAEYFEQLAMKYRRAMWCPMLPVAIDPHAPGYDQWREQESRAKEVAPDPLAPRNSSGPDQG